MYQLCRVDLERLDEYRPRIKALAAELRGRFRITRIILFGSFARDPLRENVHEMSDIDLVIVGDVAEDFFDRIGVVMGMTDLPVEPWVYTDEEWKGMIEAESPFAEEVLETGVDL